MTRLPTHRPRRQVPKAVGFVLLATFVLAGCKSQEQGGIRAVEPRESMSEDPYDVDLPEFSLRLEEDAEAFQQGGSAAYTLEAMRLHDGQLKAIVEAPACKSLQFRLVWNGRMKKSVPARAQLRLLRADQGSCNERGRYLLRADLATLTQRLGEGGAYLRVQPTEASLGFRVDDPRAPSAWTGPLAVEP